MAEDTVGLDLEAEIDRLYAGPLSSFVEERNELSRRLRATGQREPAAEVKRLTKPSITAWATNQAVHHERDTFEALKEATRGMQDAHASDPSGLKTHGEARRDALGRLVEAAAHQLREAGSPASRSQIRSITGNFEALALLDEDSGTERPGRLSRDLDVPGFGAFTGLAAAAPAAGKPARKASRSGKSARGRKTGAKTGAKTRETAGKSSTARATRLRKRRQELEKALETAEAEVARASRVAMKASARSTGLQERNATLQKEAGQAQREAERAARAADRAAIRAAESEEALAEARQAEREAVDVRRAAEAAAEAATRALEALNDD